MCMADNKHAKHVSEAQQHYCDSELFQIPGSPANMYMMLLDNLPVALRFSRWWCCYADWVKPISIGCPEQLHSHQ
jgi:hypothetical protein